uniref:Vac14_Fig4_bd domain-containing protein n=1 Tax=Angiostrongylus cantonensis TaxID=6313 RepID=A0A0K0DMM9_ANGCA
MENPWRQTHRICRFFHFVLFKEALELESSQASLHHLIAKMTVPPIREKIHHLLLVILLLRPLGYVSILHVFVAHLDLVAETVGLPRLRDMRRASISIFKKPVIKGEELNSAKPPLDKVTRTSLSTNSMLRDSFKLTGKDGKGRRSFDRGTDYVVTSVENDKGSCVLM